MSDITKIKVDGEPESSYKLFPKNREFEKRAGGNIGSQSGVQSDWNQNDETQPDYIKNRPFYKELRSMTVENVTDGTLEGFPIFSVGDTVNVNVDGVEHSLVAYNDDALVTIGDTYSNIDNGEGQLGWQIYVVSDDNLVNFYAKEAHTVSYSGDFVYHTIDPKYIRDMYYTVDPVETVLVEECTVAFNESSGLYKAGFPSTFEATVGETYKVSWDGTVYECTCVNISETPLPFIGNLSIEGLGSDTGEPFLMGVDNGKEILISTADTSASHTFSISEFVSEVVKIDPKYLPKAAFITYDSNTNTYSSYLTNDELYEIMLDGRQVVLRTSSSNEYQYLTKWTKQASGRIDLTFAGNRYLSLISDGTIIVTPDI